MMFFWCCRSLRTYSALEMQYEELFLYGGLLQIKKFEVFVFDIKSLS